MTLFATSSDPQARATRPLSEPALAYFPDARSASSGRDHDAGAPPNNRGVAVHDDLSKSEDHGHVPVLLDRCVELLKPALTRHHPDGTGAVLVDATLGAGGHTE